jgi:hypothetical protein
MTDDLVKRLRDLYGANVEEFQTIGEAADRIEQLEMALQWIDKWLDPVIQVSRDIPIIIGGRDTKRYIAEALAGEKKDG